MQELLVAIIFFTAIFYLVKLAYSSFFQSNSCPKGCGSCGGIDVEKIQRQIKKKEYQ